MIARTLTFGIRFALALASRWRNLYYRALGVKFDGYCVLCSGFVQFCFVHDGDGRLKFASAQSPLGRRVIEALGLPANTLDRTILLIEDDEVFSQSTAVLRSLRHLRGWPRWLMPLRVVPRQNKSIVIAGRFADAAILKAQPTKNATFIF